MKKEVKEGNLTKIIDEISGILDENYFHVNVKLNEKFIGGIEWVVYYKNLKRDDCYSDKNRPLLSSRKNTIADIYILKDIFNELKLETEKEAGYDFFNDVFTIYLTIREIKEKASLGMLNIFTIYVLANIIIISIANSILVSLINMIICVLVAIYYVYKNRKLDKLVVKAENIVKNTLLKNIIKGKGLGFVKEIRRELHNKGVYKYGINEKTGKTIE